MLLSKLCKSHASKGGVAFLLLNKAFNLCLNYI